MSQRFLSYGLIDTFKVGRVLKPVAVKYGNDLGRKEAQREAFEVLQARLARKPREWVLWCALGLHSAELGDYATWVRAFQKAHELRPRDPGSTYHLAIALYALTTAKYTGLITWTAGAFSPAKLSSNPDHDAYDPLKAQQALDQLNLTVDQAAEESLSLRDELLTLRISSEQRMMVRDDLAALYVQFPHLEARVKSKRKASTGLFAVARGDVFNEAAEHFARLRYLMFDPLNFQAELVEVIRLCQIAISKNRSDGDAHVLLANAFLSAAGKGIGGGWALKYAAAVVYQWKTKGLLTMYSGNGEQVFAEVVGALVRRPADDINPIELQASMILMKEAHMLYDRAVSPDLTQSMTWKSRGNGEGSPENR